MNLSRLLMAASGALAAGGAAWFITRPVEGEPAPPIPLPEAPDSIAVDPATGAVHRGGGSGIAPTEQEIEALGRVVASEAGSGTPAEQRCIAWCVRNRFRGKSIYAKQHPWRSQKGGDPPFSSARDATAATRRLAAEVLAADQSQDPTGGATSFFEPRMQDLFFKAGELARKGETGDRRIDGMLLTDITRFRYYKKDASAIRASWGKSSAVYARAGRFEFWGSASTLAKRGNPAPREVAVGDILDMLDAEEIGCAS